MNKLIVTIGPATIKPEIIRRIKIAGANSFRINLSHSNEASLEHYFNVIKSCGVTPAIDTQGAQLRVEEVGISKNVDVDDQIEIIFGWETEAPVGASFLRLNHPEASDQAQPNDILRIDFTGFSVELKQRLSSNRWSANVITEGEVTLNRAADIIDKPIKLDVLTSFDRFGLEYAVSRGCSEVYASFVSSADQVKLIRNTIHSDSVRLISKIETSIGLCNAEDIIRASDEVLVDRGDLSREIGIPAVPIAVDGVIKLGAKHNTPVHIATNVLDSMMEDRLPSRAEISDIFSLLKSGASGFVLAAEAAIGKHPVESAALLRYLMTMYENHKNGMHGVAQFCKPDAELIGKELLNWL